MRPTNLSEIVSCAPQHLGQTFVKVSPKTEDPVKPPVNSVGPVVADLVRGLGIPCENEDFHCPEQCDNPNSHVETRLRTEVEPETTPEPES